MSEGGEANQVLYHVVFNHEELCKGSHRSPASCVTR